MTSRLLSHFAFSRILRRLALAVVTWIALAVAVVAHGAWLGGGTIDLSEASKTAIRANVASGLPAVQNGDIVEVMADFPVIASGTLDGPGGYATMYIPSGVEVVGAFITDVAGNPVAARPAQASTGSGVSKGWGPKGQQTFDVSPNGWQPSSTDQCTLAGYSTDLCNGGLAYIYGDTGVFYSTRSDTALFANGSDTATLTNGYLVNPTNGTPWSSVGGSGTARVHNKWDAVQVNAFGSGGTIDSNGFTASEETSITSGRGATPFRSGSPVAGPESGYDWDRYGTTGPWQRIQYDGACRADDPAELAPEGPATGAGSVYPETTDPGVNSVTVCTEVPTVGYDLNTADATALPAGSNAVRFAFGGIAQGEIFYAKLRVRITDADAIGVFNAEGHGGDSAEGASAGNDNPWRYWVAGTSALGIPSPNDLNVAIRIVEVNGAPYDGNDIPQAATVRYRVTYANSSLGELTNAALQVTLPSQTSGTSNFTVISGEDIRPVVNPSGGTFSFQNLPVLAGLGSGAIEFDVSTIALAGETVTASTDFQADQGGPVSDTVSVNVAVAPVEVLPSCNGARFSVVDWATDTPAALDVATDITRYGLPGTLTVKDAGSLTRPAAMTTSSTLYAPAYGGNPMLDAQYVEIETVLGAPVRGIRFYITDIDRDESITVFGELNGALVSPSMTDGPASYPMGRRSNPDGSVTGERSTLAPRITDESFALQVGFNQAVDRVIVRHTVRQFSSNSFAGTSKFSDFQACADFTDAPSALGHALHITGTLDSLYLGPDVDAEEQPGNAVNADSDNDNGVDIPPMTQGLLATITATVSGADGRLQGWIDFDGNSVMASGTAEQIAIDAQDDGTGGDQVAGDGVIQIEVVVPGDAVLDQTYARFRWATQAGLEVFEFASDGEVEDYAVTILAAPVVDRGDAPASYGDPQHIIADAGISGTYLGAISPDPEAASQASADATGDDLDGNDDEDGVVMPTLFPGAAGQITVNVNEVIGALGPLAYLQAFIDFDGDGTFDTPGDQIALDVQDGSALDQDGAVNGQIILNVNVPSTATLSPTFARFRWSTVSGVTQLATDGEVEDYQFSFSSDPAPFICDAGLYQIFDGPSSLRKLTVSSSGGGLSVNETTIGSSTENLDAGWGYNELDNYMYGVPDGTTELWRLDATGNFQKVADLPNTVDEGTIAGDIMPNGTMIYRERDNRFRLVDITDPANPVDLGQLQISGNNQLRDFAYNPIDGHLYGIDRKDKRVNRISANGGVAGNVSAQGFGIDDYDGSYTSVWFDEDGNFYAFDADTDEVFVIDIGTNGSGSGNRQLLGTVSADGGASDGASCRGPAPYQPGAISGNVYYDNNASDVKDNGEPNLGAGIEISLYDDKGTPNDPDDDTLLATAETETDGTYFFAAVSPLSTYRVELDESDEDLPPGSTIGTSNPLLSVSVAPGTTTINEDFGFDAQAADLSITKVGLNAATGLPVTTAGEGDVIDWVITITNDGSGSPSGVKVLELIPSGFEYLSDDAPETGDTYDPGTGVWFVDEILVGATETLTIRTRVLGSGDDTNVAEVISSSLPDQDSDPNTGVLTDDFDDGVADDDEAIYQVSLVTGTRLIEGRVFVDDGSGGGTAHNGVADGTESGTQEAELRIFDGAGGLLASPVINADGTWSYALAASYSDAITISVLTKPQYLTISENTGAAPSPINADPHDGQFTFTPDASSDYSDLNFGLIVAPTLTQDQTSSIEPGQIATLLHEYTATSAGTVVFSYANEVQSSPGSYVAALYHDSDCDGTADTPLNAPLSVATGERVCLVSRVSAGSGVGPGSTFSYDLNAETTFAGTTKTATATNTDKLESGGGKGQLTLRKTVENETQNTPEGTSNSGAIGDVLHYRIHLENPSQATATDVTIYDRTPAYTRLSEPIPSPVEIGPGLVCSIGVPASNAAGYAGSLRWDCVGNYAPGANGAVTFRVEIAP